MDKKDLLRDAFILGTLVLSVMSMAITATFNPSAFGQNFQAIVVKDPYALVKYATLFITFIATLAGLR